MFPTVAEFLDAIPFSDSSSLALEPRSGGAAHCGSVVGPMISTSPFNC
jgi:hypothetical protein